MRSLSVAIKGVEGYEATFKLTLQFAVSVTTFFIGAKFSFHPAATVLSKVKMIPFDIFIWMSTSLVIAVVGWNHIVRTMIVFTIRVLIQ